MSSDKSKKWPRRNAQPNRDAYGQGASRDRELKHSFRRLSPAKAPEYVRGFDVLRSSRVRAFSSEEFLVSPHVEDVLRPSSHAAVTARYSGSIRLRPPRRDRSGRWSIPTH